MKLKVYSIAKPSAEEVDANPIAIDPRIDTVIHKAATFDPFWKWIVSEKSTSGHIGHGLTRATAIAHAKERMANKSDQEIRDAIARTLNNASDLGEFIAFEANRP